MGTVQPLNEQRPVVAVVVIDGRTYRGAGNLIDGLTPVALLKLTPAPAPAPFRAHPATDIEEVVL